ncbi:MAG: FHA domain-containing protein [Tannerellaceae bacterium]|jgi:hypothetical protein|nr:FHA domain-containing protein [Tannerellaceae bacterium]
MATQQYKRTLGGSIGAGIGSVFSGSGKSYYILEHKTGSNYHHVGESQEIIVDQVEIGRDSKCQVRYDDSFETVSRRHAAIIRAGDRWKIVQLSETNSTLLNRQRIDREAFLSNGDEIQLSSNGPRLGFIIPTGSKSTVGSIGLTRRLNLFRQQALSPYKRAISVLSVLLVLAIAGGVWYGLDTSNRLGQTQETLAQTQQAMQETRDRLTDEIIKNSGNTLLVDSLSKQLAELNSRDEVHMAEVERLANRIDSIRRTRVVIVNPTPPSPATQTPGSSTVVQTSNPVSQASNSNLYDVSKHVYAVILDELRGTDENDSTNVIAENAGIIGSGFMLEDGRFVTSRHVVEPWYYYKYLGGGQNEVIYGWLNWVSFNRGKVYAKYTIVSPTGKRYSFTNEQVICNRSNDRINRVKQTDSFAEGIYRTSDTDRDDWAYFQTNVNQGLKFDNVLSTQLPQGTSLEILGYPHGQGAEDINNVQPIYSSCLTSASGQNANGLILSSNNNTEDGSSGGPVFAKKNGQFVVVGLVSGHVYQKGIIVPISEVVRR